MKHPKRVHWQDLIEGPELIADLQPDGWAISEKEGCAWYPITTSRAHLRTISNILQGHALRVRVLPI